MVKSNFTVEHLDVVTTLRRRKQLNFLSPTLHRQPPCFIAHNDLEVGTTIISILAHELVVDPRLNRNHIPKTLLERQVLKQNLEPELRVQRANRFLLRLVE
jgi:hypothetical protein